MDQSADQDEEVRQALQTAMAETFGAIGERMPSADSDARRRLASRLDEHERRLRELKEAEAIRETARKAIEAITSGWDEFAGALKQREEGLTEIIELLAETASRLDGSNSDFYRGLRHSVKGLEEVGRIDDLIALREALQDRLSSLEADVARQEVESREGWDGFQQHIKKARTEAKAMTQLVSSGSLGSLPTRKHCEQMLTELAERKRDFVVAAVALRDYQDLGRRYGPEKAKQVAKRFTKIVESGAPENFQLYHWDERTIAAIVEEAKAAEVGRQLAELARKLKASAALEGDPELEELQLDPRFGVHQAGPEESLGALAKRVEALVAAK